MRRRLRHLGLAASAAVGAAVVGLLGSQPAVPGQVTIAGISTTFDVPVESMKEARFRGVIRQQYDFSCGSAAIATLLSYHYELPTSEQEVFEYMWSNGDQAKISQHGFSLLDMKGYLASRGFAADGFRVPLDKLTEAKIPAIALIDLNGYKHFVLIKGLADGRVLVGDPALGVRAMERAEFEQMWNGILFVVRNYGMLGQKYFNLPQAWKMRPPSPLRAAEQTRQSVGSFTLNMPMPREF